MNAIPAGFEAKARKFYYRLGGRKSVAVFVPSGFEPPGLTIQLSRTIETDDARQGRFATLWRDVTGRGGQRIATLDIKLDTAHALHGALGAALKEAGHRTANAVGSARPAPIAIEAEPCRLSWYRQMHSRIFGW